MSDYCRAQFGFIALILLLPIAISPQVISAGSSFYDFTLLSSYDNNLSRAQRSVDREEDLILTAVVAANYRHLSDRTFGWQVGAHMDMTGHVRAGDLNHVAAGGSSQFFFKPVAGYWKPWYRIELFAEALWFADE